MPSFERFKNEYKTKQWIKVFLLTKSIHFNVNKKDLKRKSQLKNMLLCLVLIQQMFSICGLRFTKNFGYDKNFETNFLYTDVTRKLSNYRFRVNQAITLHTSFT